MHFLTKKLRALLPSYPHYLLKPLIHRGYSSEGNYEGRVRVTFYSHYAFFCKEPRTLYVDPMDSIS